MAGQLLINQGHEVVTHGRNRERSDEIRLAAPDAAAAVTGDLSRISEIRSVADQVNRLGRFDAVIHNAGVVIAKRAGSRRRKGLRSCSLSMCSRLHSDRVD
jgi:NAD(P)-dependent dehydrogenase (short-subunit alcohol dehydrogenase family)